MLNTSNILKIINGMVNISLKLETGVYCLTCYIIGDKNSSHNSTADNAAVASVVDSHSYFRVKLTMSLQKWTNLAVILFYLFIMYVSLVDQR